MKPIVEKVLKSGLVDRKTVELLEKTGVLPDGSVDMVQEDALKDATPEDRAKLADELEAEAENAGHLRETMLDLSKMQWPATVNISKDTGVPVADSLSCVMDKMGRYYFRIQDVDAKWFVPGYRVQRDMKEEMILESQVLYIDNQPVCVQVSTSKV